LRALTAGWLLLVLSVTLIPAFGPGTAAGVARLADVVRNLVLFAPLGLLLGLSGSPIRKAALFGGLLSAAIETAQIWIPGRHPGVPDVAVDALGVALGAGFARALIGPFSRSPARSAWLALAAGVLAAAIFLLPGVLLRPAPPPSRYFTAWTPDYPRYVTFPGKVLEASIGDVPIEPSGPSRRSATLRKRLSDGSAIALRAVAQAREAGIAPLVRINDGRWEVLLVGVQGDDLVVRRHAVAADLGFEEPLFRLPEALAGVTPGRPFRVDLEPKGAAWQASVAGSAARSIGPTPASAWRLVADSDAFPEPLQRALDALALALVFGSIAIWFRPRGPAIAGLALALAALVLAPGLTGVVSSPPGEWVGVAIGLWGGALVQSRVRRGAGARAAASPVGAQGLRG
jgi:hypothetical protein